jgi:DNA invertase Pin-like site-specific DNA recombinase
MPFYGYARVSTRDQDLAAQDAELMAARCAKVFKEKVSGAKTDRPQLAKVIGRLEPGDVLVVTRLDRLAREFPLPWRTKLQPARFRCAQT